MEAPETEGRIYFRMLSGPVSIEERDKFYAICRDVIDNLTVEKGMMFPLHITTAIGGNTKNIAIDVFGANISILEPLTSIIFEAHISIGIMFEKSVSIKFHDMSSDVSIFDGVKNLIVDLDYSNHTYSIYDLKDMIHALSVMDLVPEH